MASGEISQWQRPPRATKRKPNTSEKGSGLVSCLHKAAYELREGQPWVWWVTELAMSPDATVRHHVYHETSLGHSCYLTATYRLHHHLSPNLLFPAQGACCPVDAPPRNEVLASPSGKFPLLTCFSQRSLLWLWGEEPHPLSHQPHPLLKPFPAQTCLLVVQDSVRRVVMVTRGTELILSHLESPGGGVQS